MTRMSVCLITLVLLLGCFGNLAAQEDTYVVQKGDNLWRLAGSKLDSPLLWEQIYKDNPFLQEPGRRFQKDGIVYVLIRPGEMLVGLEKAGIVATLAPITQLRLPQEKEFVSYQPAWVWWPLALAIAILIAAWLIYRMLTRDPVNSRPAMVPGGVAEATAAVAIQQMAARMAGHGAAASTPAVYQAFNILEQVAGRIWGVMTVRYADGRSVPRRLSGERAFRARVRFADGHEETLYMLQACGNDLRIGGISRYLPGPEFRFEADPVVAPATAPASSPQPVAEPESASAPVAQAPAPVAKTPTPTQAAVFNPNGHEDLLKISFRPEENGKDSLVQAEGIDVERFTFEKNGNSITFRFREAKVK